MHRRHHHAPFRLRASLAIAIIVQQTVLDGLQGHAALSFECRHRHLICSGQGQEEEGSVNDIRKFDGMFLNSGLRRREIAYVVLHVAVFRHAHCEHMLEGLGEGNVGRRAEMSLQILPDSLERASTALREAAKLTREGNSCLSAIYIPTLVSC